MRPVTVEVEEHEELPDGCWMRFSALDEPRPISELEVDGEVCRIVAKDEDGSERPATRVLVDDSAGGQSVLVRGGSHGLRITFPDGRVEAEAYLLLAPES